MKPRQQHQACEKRIAQTWDEAYSLGFKCGTDFGFGLGWDAALREAAAEEGGEEEI
jgi:hypothetical protein